MTNLSEEFLEDIPLPNCPRSIPSTFVPMEGTKEETETEQSEPSNQQLSASEERVNTDKDLLA